jgi:hypothetical protein
MWRICLSTTFEAVGVSCNPIIAVIVGAASGHTETGIFYSSVTQTVDMPYAFSQSHD